MTLIMHISKPVPTTTLTEVIVERAAGDLLSLAPDVSSRGGARANSSIRPLKENS